MKIIKYLFLITALQSCVTLDKGTFEIYESGNKVCTIYRESGIQIEEYLNREEFDIVRYEKIGKNSFILKPIKLSKTSDTINWRVEYQKKSSNEFLFKAIPLIKDTRNYVYEGLLLKTSNNIKNQNVMNLIDKYRN